MIRRSLPVLVAVLLAVRIAAAEVVDTTADGFLVRLEQPLAAAPDRVYRALTDEIGRWWHPDHTWSGDAANLYLEAEAGGVFGERLPSGGSVQHLAVLFADPGRLLRLGGGLGPLQAMPVQGVMSFELAPATGAGTTLILNYAVAGPGAGSLAGPVDAVLAGQVARLAAHLEP